MAITGTPPKTLYGAHTDDDDEGEKMQAKRTRSLSISVHTTFNVVTAYHLVWFVTWNAMRAEAFMIGLKRDSLVKSTVLLSITIFISCMKVSDEKWDVWHMVSDKDRDKHSTSDTGRERKRKNENMEKKWAGQLNNITVFRTFRRELQIQQFWDYSSTTDFVVSMNSFRLVWKVIW